MSSIRGVSSNQELRNNIDIRDTKSLYERFIASSKKKKFPLFCIGFFLIISVLFNIYIEFIFVIGLLLIPLILKGQEKFVLPFKLPETSQRIDWHQPKPGQRGTSSQAKGIVFLGNEMGTNDELWITDSDARQHILLFGTTGAGKAFSLDEEFLTPNGWIKNKDLKEGDYIMTPFGHFSKILGLFKQEKRNMMKVYFDNGEVKKVSEDHLWEFYFNDDERKYKSFEEFRKYQIKQLGETKYMKAYLENGKQLYVPFSQNSDGIEIDLKGYSIEDFALFLKNNLNKEDFFINEENEDIYYLISEVVQTGKLKLKKEIKKVLVEKLLLDTDYAKYINYDNDLNEIVKIKIENYEIFKIIKNLYDFLGFKTQKEIDLNQQLTINISYTNTLRIVKIEEDDIEDCQCIKIEDENGLLILKNNVISHNTEALLSILTNAFIQGSGFIFVDGKADLSTFAKVFSLARSFRREEDLLVINYMTSGKDVFGVQEKLMSNTLNPFISGSSSGLTELMVGLMDSGGGSDPMWQGRAIALISAVMSGLVWIRDNEGMLLDIDKIREYLLLKKIGELSHREYGGVENIKKAIQAYLFSIPGFNGQKPIDQQEGVVGEQHGYLQMQFTRILGSLSDTYGYIFRTNLGHVDFKDIVLNRRILLVLLPALEKSEPELQNLGKIVVSCIKAMMASTLGSELDTNVKESIDNRATNALSPFYCVFDEYGYYIVKGSAVMPAQARSLGFCMIFAGQDVQSFKKNNNREEAGAIVGNCNLKIFMKVEDPEDTFELFKKTAGQVMVEVLKSKERDAQAFYQSTYYDSLNVSYEKRDRGEWLDLKEQADGEAHMIQSSGMVRAKFFFVNPEIPSNLKFRPNYFVKVEPPQKDELMNLIELTENVKNNLANIEYMNAIGNSVAKNKFVDLLSDFYNKTNQKFRPNELGTGLYLMAKYSEANIDDALISVKNQFDNINRDTDGREYMNIFGIKNKKFDNIDPNAKDIFLNNGKLRENLLEMEREINHSQSEKENIASIDKIVDTLNGAANYPSEDAQIPEDISSDQIVNVIKDLNKIIINNEEDDDDF